MNQQRRDLISVIGLMLIVTALHYFTVSRQWAIHDFYRRLYYIPIIIGAFKFRLKGGVITSIAVVFLYAPHLYWNFEAIGVVNQILEMVLFLFMGSTTGYLVERLYQNNQLLTMQLERITDMETLNENILNSMKNSLVALDLNHRVRIINEMTNQTMGFIQEGESFPYGELPMFKTLEPTVSHVLKGQKAMALKHLEIQWKASLQTYKTWIYPLKDYTGKIQGAVMVFEDVSKVSRLEEEVRRAEKLSSIGMMASGIAHEIRNPLGIVKTIIQTLRGSAQLQSSEKEGLDIVIREVDRANHVIKELLDFSKPEKGIATECNIYDLVEEMILISGKFAEQNHIKLHNQVPEDLICSIVKEKMKQAFLNLVLNAIDAMPDGGNIYIRGFKKDTYVHFEIEDEGIGIEESDIKHIFDPFFTKRENGTGLGLAVTYKIIEDHQGHLSVNSQPGKGTLFRIEIPRL